MEQLEREYFELYQQKSIFNDVCEQDCSEFRYLQANRLKILIRGKYSHMQKLIQELEYQLELDFDHIQKLEITREEKN